MLTILSLIYSPKCRAVSTYLVVTLTWAPLDNKYSTAEEAVNE
jgi:hypothetical protein